MNPALVQEPELAAVTGYYTPAGDPDRGQIKRCLKRMGVRYFEGKGGRVWTTTDLINRAGGLVSGQPAANDDDAMAPYGPEFL
jgi:hypothetical protein